MPYIHWTGIDINGKTHKGSGYTATRKQLELVLSKKGIALLGTKNKFTLAIKKRIKTADAASLFMQLSALVKAHVLLSDACHLVGCKATNYTAQKIMFDLEHALTNGVSVQEAFLQNNNTLDPFIANLLCSGDDSGNLPHALETIAQYLQKKAVLYQKIKNALFIPFITALFLVVCVIFVSTYIAPQICLLYKSIGKEAPQSTLLFFNISALFSLKKVAIATITMFLLWTANASLKRNLALKKHLDYWILFLPFYGPLTRYALVATWAQALCLLIEGGAPMAHALAAAQKGIENLSFKKSLFSVQNDVLKGDSLAFALEKHPFFFTPEIIATILVGQEAESLPYALSCIANEQFLLLEAHLGRFSALLQPALMLILGIFITGFIVSIYGPLLAFSAIP